MKFKLDNTEFLCLIEVLELVCNHFRKVMPITEDKLESKMFLAMFEELHIELKKRSYQVQKNYKLTLKPYTAIAFFTALNKPADDQQTYQARLVKKICNHIHQQYA
jgi:hypothetical protein